MKMIYDKDNIGVIVEPHMVEPLIKIGYTLKYKGPVIKTVTMTIEEFDRVTSIVIPEVTKKPVATKPTKKRVTKKVTK